MQYAAFRKNLYIVPRALARLTDEEVADRREDLQIKVTCVFVFWACASVGGAGGVVAAA